jgi:hypothetical protein
MEYLRGNKTWYLIGIVLYILSAFVGGLFTKYVTSDLVRMEDSALRLAIEMTKFVVFSSIGLALPLASFGAIIYAMLESARQAPF